MTWIKLTEKLPELDQEVIATDGTSTIIAYFSHKIGWDDEDKEFEFCDRDFCSYDINEFTHWSPLPTLETLK